MKKLRSINPFTHKLLFEFEQSSPIIVQQKIDDLDSAYKQWKRTSYEERAKVLVQLAELLEERKQALAETITREMGKPIKQSISEIEKCAWVCRHYAENGGNSLKAKEIKTDASKSFVRYEPIGTILAVMPWNYPFWQFFRVLAPNIMLGNTVLLKHASSVCACSIAITELAEALDLDYKLFDAVLVESSRVEELIKDDKIKGVTLTGSEKAGASVAAVAGKEIKKTVLELGGSNAVIIFFNADLDKYMDEIVNARFQNTGQSCIAGKRYIVQEGIAKNFKARLLQKVQELNIQNPLNEEAKLGPMANEGLAVELEKQLKSSLKDGAKLLFGGNRDKAHFDATIVEVEDINTAVFREETFGPLAVIKTFDKFDEAIALSNASTFGLGASIYTENIELAMKIEAQLEEGAVFINSLVKSDPRLPFGGIGKSGYGRELSEIGLTEFANVKTVYVK